MNYPAKILIVEDEAIIALGMRMILTSEGFAVVEVVDNADDAFRRIEQAKPDLVLMDIHLKGEMDGVEATTIIRSRYDLPVIYVTAHANPEIVERAQATEPAAYLVKPVSGETVKAAIIMALHQRDRTKSDLSPSLRGDQPDSPQTQPSETLER